jgi:hypothetical protein
VDGGGWRVEGEKWRWLDFVEDTMGSKAVFTGLERI